MEIENECKNPRFTHCRRRFGARFARASGAGDLMAQTGLARLAGLDRNMLADIGLTRADLNDALSGAFWEDPTALLRERAIERRLYRVRPAQPLPDVENGFHRPPTGRPARQAI